MNKLNAANSSIRLQAALAIGTNPDPTAIPLLVQRCGVEEDFYVRDMLTWALTRMPHAEVIPALIPELDSPEPFAASQALHTFSKLQDPSVWAELKKRPELLHRENTSVTAWRSFAGLVPAGDLDWLLGELAQEFDKGSAENQRSLSRAMVELGNRGASISAFLAAFKGPHARATAKLWADPETDFLADLQLARRVDNMGAC